MTDVKTILGVPVAQVKSVSNIPITGVKTILGSNVNHPIKFTLTPIGTGTEVATLRLLTSKDITISVDGNARFYDNSGGTTNAGTTRTVEAGALRTYYLKCPSGTSSLLIPDAKCVLGIGSNGIDGWTSSANAVSISGDVSGLTNLNYLQIGGSNTISGNVSGLTNLTRLYVGGSNTISGDVSGLTNLDYLYVTGSNTISGDVSGLTRLTYLYVGGSNTISGDVGGSGTSAVVNGITNVRLSPCRMSEYTAGAIWSLTDTSYINPSPGYGYSATEIDNILIDMAASLGTVSGKTITLQGTSAARTSASNTAVATLNGKGWTIVTN